METPNCNLAKEFVTDFGCVPYDPVGFVGKFYGIGLSLIGATALIFLILGSYQIMTSRGNREQLKSGKSYIFYAILGLLFAIFGFVFIEVVIVDVLKIPGFSS